MRHCSKDNLNCQKKMDFKIILLLFVGLVSQQLVEGALPVFTDTAAGATVAEDAPAGTTVTHDGDSSVSNTPDSVTIVTAASDAGANDAFSVALNAGATDIIITVKAAGVLDYEAGTTMAVHIRATSGTDATTTGTDFVLTVTLTDANDNAPEFALTSGCIGKTSTVAASTSITTFGATDADSATNGLDGTAPYAFTATSTKFDINTGTGEITVKAGQTLASGGYWTMKITAKDQGGTPLHTSTGTLTVCVGTDCCSGTVFIRGTVLGLVLTVLSYYL